MSFQKLHYLTCFKRKIFADKLTLKRWEDDLEANVLSGRTLAYEFRFLAPSWVQIPVTQVLGV